MLKDNLPIVYCHGGKKYFLGSGLSFWDTMKDPNVQAGTAGVAGIGAGLVDSIADDPTNKLAGTGSGAMKGLAAGAALGPIGMLGGAAIGGLTGFLGAKKAGEEQLLADNKAGAERYKAGTAGMNPNGRIYAFGSKLTEFNEGGTHEVNPNGGVPQGVGENGQPNLVEEGETKHKDYIFSDRLALANGKHYNLGGRLNGNTFADISKKLSKLAEERPNDPIANRGQQAMLGRLQQANDDAKMFKEYEESSPEQHFNRRTDVVETDRIFKFGGYTFKDF